MKKLAIIMTLIGLLITGPAAAKPQIDHTTFYQEELTYGEDIVFGVQFEDPDHEIDYATATLRSRFGKHDFVTLLDRNDDNFFTGRLGKVKGGRTYFVDIKVCDSTGECATESYSRYAKYISFF